MPDTSVVAAVVIGAGKTRLPTARIGENGVPDSGFADGGRADAETGPGGFCTWVMQKPPRSGGSPAANDGLGGSCTWVMQKPPKPGCSPAATWVCHPYTWGRSPRGEVPAECSP